MFSARTVNSVDLWGRQNVSVLLLVIPDGGGEMHDFLRFLELRRYLQCSRKVVVALEFLLMPTGSFLLLQSRCSSVLLRLVKSPGFGRRIRVSGK